MIEEEEFDEIVIMQGDNNYMEIFVCFLVIGYILVLFFMLIVYYCFKVFLVIFKREKEIVRKLEFEGLWVVEQLDEDFKGYWDKLVLSIQLFLDSYWDKFVKKKVRVGEENV